MKKGQQNLVDHIRIDERLLHGQILQAWVPVNSYKHILISDDECCRDCLLQSVMKMAVMPGVEITISPVGATCMNYNKNPIRPIIVITKSLTSAGEIIEQGCSCRKIIIGNIHSSETRVKITGSVFLSEEELELCKAMEDNGVDITLQAVPFEKALDIKDISERYNLHKKENN